MFFDLGERGGIPKSMAEYFYQWWARNLGLDLVIDLMNRISKERFSVY